MSAAIVSPATYAVRLEIAYADRPLNRVTSAFRLVLVVPILLLFALIAWDRSSGLLTVSVGLLVVFRRKPTLVVRLPLVKWFLAIPHFVVLAVLFIGVIGASIGAWFAILFTGRYPRALFDYIVGVMRWDQRVTGYAFTLVTDQYPTFSLKP